MSNFISTIQTFYSANRFSSNVNLARSIWIYIYSKDVSKCYLGIAIGGSRRGAAGTRPLRGPNSFVLTYKFFRNVGVSGVYDPNEVGVPSYGKSWIRHWFAAQKL